MERLDARRERTEGIAVLADGFALVGGVFGRGTQMMPLLIAVAIAMARLLADSFWMAWVM